MSTDPHHVTAQHIHGLAAADKMRDSNSTLADTDDGLRYINPGDVFADGSKVRRLLLASTDLREDADAAGLSISAYLKANAGRIAADLNAVLAE